MPNLFNLIKPRGEKDSLQRNNFDLYNAHAYSQKAGVIEPIKCVHTVPKDFFDIDIEDSTQTFAMNSAAFLKARKEISAYYVPYNYIWSNFNQYQATREDPKSSILKTRGIAYEPRVALSTLYLASLEFFAGYVYREYALKIFALINWMADRPFGVDPADFETNGYYKSLFETNKANFDRTQTTNGAFHFVTNVSAFELLSGVSSSQDFFLRDAETYQDLYMDVVGCYRWSYWLRKLDMLGYGNLLPVFDQALVKITTIYDSFVSSIVGGGSLDPTHFWENTGQPDVISVIAEMWDILKNSCIGNSSATTFNEAARFVSVYPLFAYNHIFYHMFRNSYYDLDYDVRNYNCDFLDCTSLAGSVLHNFDLPARFFDLAHHQYKKDMFTGVLPDVQFGVVTSVDITGVSIINDSLIGLSVNQDVKASASNGKIYVTGSASPQDSVFNIPSAFDVLALKRAEMLQVYHQNLMRAGNRTSDIFKAIYGSDPKSELHNSPYFAEVLGEDMNLDPVISTADTGHGDNGSLGDIAARGLFGGSRHFKFSTEDFGCLLFLAYVVPEPFYNSTRIDPHLMNLTPEDHLIPELMNLGFSPVLSEWLCNIVSSATNLNIVRGYAPPYLEFKTDISLAHGAFASAKVVMTKYNSHNFNAVHRGSLSHWVATRIDMQSENVTSLKTFYIHPSVLDSIFKVANDDTYETDQFISLTKINIDAVRQFSKLGLPSF